MSRVALERRLLLLAEKPGFTPARICVNHLRNTGRISKGTEHRLASLLRYGSRAAHGHPVSLNMIDRVLHAAYMFILGPEKGGQSP